MCECMCGREFNSVQIPSRPKVSSIGDKVLLMERLVKLEKGKKMLAELGIVAK